MRVGVSRAGRLALVACLLKGSAPVLAQQSTDELARTVQNPVAALISVPIQENANFGVGPHGDVANVLNIQPVIPFSLGSWNVISRTIAPIIYVPDLVSGLPETVNDPQGDDGSFGLGDINETLYFSPPKLGPLILGVGPSLNLPTATDDSLGSGKWSAGPGAVALVQPGRWTIGLLARQLWSFAGEDDRDEVSQMLLQPFVSYNLPGGWSITSAPVITANWEAERGDDRWTIPVGGGVGKVFKLGGQAMNASLQAYDNIEKPYYGPDWSLRLTVAFLFPK